MLSTPLQAITGRRPAALAVLALAVQLLVPALPAAAAERLFTLTDARGDDHGNGHLVYPLEGELRPGDLDLLTLAAVREKGGTRFELTFAREIDQPGPGAIDDLGTPLDQVARYGFYTFNVDLYVDRDRRPGSGTVRLLPGREAEVSPDFAWERAIILTPRPNVARGQIKSLMMKSLKAELKSGDPRFDDEQYREMRAMVPGEVEQRIFFPTRVRTRGRTVTFFVPDEFLGGPADPAWGYVVLVTGADLAVSFDLGTHLGSEEVMDRMMVLPLAHGTWTDRFGGGREDDPLQPPIVDVLVPKGVEQERVLDDYDPVAGRPVALPGVVPAEG
jgi:hypothetical protein